MKRVTVFLFFVSFLFTFNLYPQSLDIGESNYDEISTVCEKDLRTDIQMAAAASTTNPYAASSLSSIPLSSSPRNLRVLFLYTMNAKAKQNIVSLVHSTLETINQSYFTRDKLFSRIELAACIPTGYGEVSAERDYQQVKTDERIQEYRQRFSADVCVLITSANNGSSGINRPDTTSNIQNGINNAFATINLDYGTFKDNLINTLKSLQQMPYSMPGYLQAASALNFSLTNPYMGTTDPTYLDVVARTHIITSGDFYIGQQARVYMSVDSSIVLKPGFRVVAGKDANNNPTSYFHAKIKDHNYRNFYGISFHGQPKDNLAYAKEMGYDYVFHSWNMSHLNYFNNSTDTLKKYRSNLKFIIVTPEDLGFRTGGGHASSIKTDSVYDNVAKDFYNKFVVLRNRPLSDFPYNLASIWYTNEKQFSLIPDFQQQVVIAKVIDEILSYVATKEVEGAADGFIFGGFSWDVSDLGGDFTEYDPSSSTKNRHVTLRSMTDIEDSGKKHPDVIHNYTTFSEGHAQFYKQLFRRTKEKYPNMKVFMDPWLIQENWLDKIKDRPDAYELMPDMLLQEANTFTNGIKTNNFAFIDQALISDTMNNGLINSFTQTGASSPFIFNDEFLNRELAVKTALKGSSLNYHGGLESGHDVTTLLAVTKLIRAIPGWENMNKTPLNLRWLNASGSNISYQSPTAYISPSVVYGTHPKTKDIYIVFNTATSIGINGITSDMQICSTDAIFRGTPIGNNAGISISGNRVSATSLAVGKCFIIKSGKGVSLRSSSQEEGLTDITEIPAEETEYLFQNMPNPFDETTVIRYRIPEDANIAFLQLYDLQGRIIDTIEIPEKGESRITIESSRLSPGMYIYSLVIDGKRVGNKRMMKR